MANNPLPGHLQARGYVAAGPNALFGQAPIFQVGQDTYSGYIGLANQNALVDRSPNMILQGTMDGIGQILAQHGNYPNTRGRDFLVQVSLALQGGSTVSVIQDARVRRNDSFHERRRKLRDHIVVNLARIRQGAQSGDIDYDELFWWNAILVRVAFTNRPHPRDGGCDSRVHTRNFLSEDGRVALHARSLKSTNNDCAFACLLNYINKMKVDNLPGFQTIPLATRSNCGSASTLRRICALPKNLPVSIEEFSLACTYFRLGLLVYDGTFDETNSPRVIHSSEGSLGVVKVVLNDGHYFQVLFKQMPGQRKFCEDCSLNYLNDTVHHCTARCDKCGHVKRAGHECALNTSVVLESSASAACQRERITLPSTVDMDVPQLVARLACVLTCPDSALRHGLLHGPGGTGKSFIILELMSVLRGLGTRFACVAPTGAASLLINGAETIHRFFGIGKKNSISTPPSEAVRQLECVIIDEFSMVGSGLLSAIDKRLRSAKGTPRVPFGGVRILFSGDAMQLQPVQDKFLFMSRLWHMIDDQMDVVYLDKMYRFESDPAWGEALKEIRIGQLTEQTKAMISSRVVEQADYNDIHFYARRALVSRVNKEYLDNLDGRMIDAGGSLGKVKVGARVMMTHNSQIEQGIANGSCGELIGGTRNEGIVVQFDGIARPITVRLTYEEPGSKKKIIPLVLAKALTIHKAQGATVDKMVIKIDDAFVSGQGYVALSRVRTLAGLKVLGNVPERFLVDRSCLKFEEWTRTPSADRRPHFLSPGELNMVPDPEEDEPNRLVSLRAARGEGVYEIISSPYADGMIMDIDADDQIMVISRQKSTRKSFKAIFFDFETYNSAANGNKHTVYAVNARLVYYDAGQRGRCCNIKSLSVYDDWLKHDEEPSDRVAFDFFEWVMDQVSAHDSEIAALPRGKSLNCSDSIYLCAYNGNKFDLFWFARYILRTEKFATNYDSAMVSRGSSSLVSLSLTSKVTDRQVLKTHDICDIIHMNLATAAGCYGGDISHVEVSGDDAEWFNGGEATEKDVFPHSYITDETYPPFARGEPLCLNVDDFPKKDRRKVQEMAASGEIDLRNFKLLDHCKEYLMKDVDALIKVYIGFDKICLANTFGTCVFGFCTMAQLTWYCFLRNMDTKHIAYEKFDRKRNRKDIVSKIYRLSRKDNEFVGKAIYGGCVFPRIKEFDSEDLGKSYDDIEDYLVDFDLCSMYVHIMMEYEFPIGEHRWGLDVDKKRYLDAILAGDLSELGPAVLEVEFRFKHDELHPAVPHRHHKTGQLLWANCAVDDPDSPTPTYKEGEFIRGIYTSVDVQNMIESEAEFKPVVHKVLFWNEMAAVFKTWITKTFKMKNDSAEKMSAARDAIKLAGEARAAGTMSQNDYDFYVAEQNKIIVQASALKQFGKTMGNALYGSTAKRDHDSCFVLIQTDGDLQDFLDNYKWEDSMNIERYQQKLDKILILHGKPSVNVDDGVNVMCSRPRYLGAFVLSYTRQMIGRLVNKINPKCRGGGEEGIKMQPFYGDTDSLFVHASAIPRLQGEIGNVHGKLTDDIYEDWHKGVQKDGVTPQFAKIVEARFLRPKEYADKAILPNNKTDSTIKLKGIPSSKYGDIKISWNDGDNGPQTATSVTYDMLKRCEVLRMNVLRMQADGATKEECDNYFAGMKVLSADRLNKRGIRLNKAARSQGQSLFTINNADMTRCIFKGEWEGRKFSEELGHPYLVPHGYGYGLSEEPSAKRSRT